MYHELDMSSLPPSGGLHCTSKAKEAGAPGSWMEASTETSLAQTERTGTVERTLFHAFLWFSHTQCLHQECFFALNLFLSPKVRLPYKTTLSVSVFIILLCQGYGINDPQTGGKKKSRWSLKNKPPGWFWSTLLCSCHVTHLREKLQLH